jgi:hypothetical protein
VIEASVAAQSGRVLHIDDASLARMTQLHELADYVASGSGDYSVSAP